MKKYDIFISYCRSDIAYADHIVKKLREENYSIFFAKDSISILKETFASQILNYLENAKVLLFVYSANTEQSQWQRRELEYYIQHHKDNNYTIIPILLCDIPDNSWYKSVLGCLNTIQWENCDIKLFNYLSRKGTNISSDKVKQKKAHNGFKSLKFLLCALLSFVIVIGVSIYLIATGNKVPITYKIDDDWSADSVIVDSCFIDSLAADSCVIDNEFTDIPNESSTTDSPNTVGDIDDTPTTDDDQSGNNDIEYGNGQVLPNRDMENESDDNSLIILGIVLCGIFMAGISSWIVRQQLLKKRKNIKISANQDSNIYIDGEFITQIKAYEVLSRHINKGAYIISFESVKIRERQQVEVDIFDVSKTKIINFKYNSGNVFAEMKSIKIFIAGSTKLVHERDALRSTISKMYNKHKDDNLLVEAYSFDDFPRDFTIEGQQKLYDEFIRNEANWVVFITDGTMGDKTIWELENAIEAHKELGHPRILMYSKPENIKDDQKEIMSKFKKLLNEEDNYWIDYDNLDTIRSSFREHLDWDLFNLLKSEMKKAV